MASNNVHRNKLFQIKYYCTNYYNYIISDTYILVYVYSHIGTIGT